VRPRNPWNGAGRGEQSAAIARSGGVAVRGSPPGRRQRRDPGARVFVPTGIASAVEPRRQRRRGSRSTRGLHRARGGGCGVASSSMSCRTHIQRVRERCSHIFSSLHPRLGFVRGRRHEVDDLPTRAPARRSRVLDARSSQTGRSLRGRGCPSFGRRGSSPSSEYDDGFSSTRATEVV